MITIAGKTTVLEAGFLNAFRATAYAAPASVYVGLFTTAPTDAGTGGTEVSGGAYARQAIAAGTGGAAAWNAPSGTPRQISNVNTITFPTPTADWAPAGTPVVAVGVFSSLAGAASTDLLYWTTTQADGSTAISKIIQTGDTVTIAGGNPGALIIRED